jgi:hypothetical protein
MLNFMYLKPFLFIKLGFDSNNLFEIKSHVELNSIHKQISNQFIIYYNFYVWNKILIFRIEFNYIVWNTCGNELNFAILTILFLVFFF